MRRVNRGRRIARRVVRLILASQQAHWRMTLVSSASQVFVEFEMSFVVSVQAARSSRFFNPDSLAGLRCVVERAADAVVKAAVVCKNTCGQVQNWLRHGIVTTVHGSGLGTVLVASSLRNWIQRMASFKETHIRQSGVG